MKIRHSTSKVNSFAGIREHFELRNMPNELKGISIALIAAGILAMAFMGFSGLV